MSKPNLVLIMADQLRYDLVGVHTPNIDRLLNESCVLERVYCASPLCVPARGSFFTGHYPNVTGSLINPWEPKERRYGLVKAGLPNLYTLLEDDWDSWHTGKQHLMTEDEFDESAVSQTHWLSLEKGYEAFLKAAGKRPPGGKSFKALVPEMVGGTTTRAVPYSIPTLGCYEEGFDYFFDGYITRTSLEAIASRDRDKPLFLSAMFLAPHPPLDIPEPWFSLVETLPLPENVGVWSPGQSPLQLYNLPGFLGTRYTRRDWEEVWKVYAGLVALFDHCVGQIIAALESEGLYDDTLILFTSDHGEMLGSHCLWQKMCMYEEATRVPLAFKLPRGSRFHKRSNALASHIDVLPTLCDLLSLTPPPGLPGLSLRGAIEEGTPLARDEVYIQFDGNGARGNFSRCIVEERYKLVVDIFKDEVFFELYDVLDDHQEQKNLAFTHAERVLRMSKKLLTHMRRTADLVTFTLEDYSRFLRDYSSN